jgi:hypothetical protein
MLKLLKFLPSFVGATFALLFLTIPASADLGDFLGVWVNADPNTGGITRVVISQAGPWQVNVHVFGSCHPTDCDWGSVPGHAYTESVGSSDVRSIVARFTSSFSDDNIVFREGHNGSIRMELFVAFTDHSGRNDYVSIAQLDRAPSYGPPLPPPPFPIPGPGPGPGPGPYMAEDCVGFGHPTVEFVGGSWKLVDGPHWISDFGSNQAAAMEALHVVHHYHFDAQCFVTRASGSQMTYWKSGGGVPNNSMSHSDCIPLHESAVEATFVAGRWKVVDTSNNDWLLDYGSNQSAAEQAASVVHYYHLNRQCFVNRSPGPPLMQYWLSH